MTRNVNTSDFGPSQLAVWRAFGRRISPLTYCDLEECTGLSNDAVRGAVNRLAARGAIQVEYDESGYALVQSPNPRRSRAY